jgi:hypothetical protein
MMMSSVDGSVAGSGSDDDSLGGLGSDDDSGGIVSAAGGVAVDSAGGEVAHATHWVSQAPEKGSQSGGIVVMQSLHREDLQLVQM